MVGTRKLAAALTLTALAACSGSHDDALARLEAAVQRATPLAWGKEALPEVMASMRARFECMWPRLEDPASEIDCRIANIEAATRCLERAESDVAKQRCWAPERRPCAESAALREASKACE